MQAHWVLTPISQIEGLNSDQYQYTDADWYPTWPNVLETKSHNTQATYFSIEVNMSRLTDLGMQSDSSKQVVRCTSLSILIGPQHDHSWQVNPHHLGSIGMTVKFQSGRSIPFIYHTQYFQNCHCNLCLLVTLM